jgi:hypothetical protein|tara:strand:+ start:778 stop:987 length:210 start_codon:yes stop_codon:yes gene_type:complete
MVMPGETIATGASVKCGEEDCQNDGPMVLQSGAGYYVGYFCRKCGPYSRETGYYRTHDEAKENMFELRS